MAQATKEKEGSESSSDPQSGQEESRTTGESSQTTDPGSGTPPSGAEGPTSEGRESPFSHPRLKGRSPEEVERLFSTMEATVTEQKRTLDETYEQMKRRGAQETPSPTPDPAAARPTEKEFWNDPVGTMEKLLKTHLDETISPFKEDLRASRAGEAERRIREEFPDFDDYKPYVDEMARKAGNPSPSYDELKSYYIYAVGVASRYPQWHEQVKRGGAGTREEPQEAPPRQPTPPPQNRASSQPLPDAGGGGKDKRPLTEQEKRLAREFGMTEDEYRDYSSEDPMEL